LITISPTIQGESFKTGHLTSH